jgi:hypothetical protein
MVKVQLHRDDQGHWWVRWRERDGRERVVACGHGAEGRRRAVALAAEAGVEASGEAPAPDFVVRGPGPGE